MNTIRRLSEIEAVSLIPDGATIALAGSGGGLLEPDALLAALGERYRELGHPRGVRIIHALGIGDGESRGLNHLAQDGLLSGAIGGHWSWAPGIQEMVRSNRIDAHAWPAGVISTMLREVGAGRPGVFTKVGIGTFVDPRFGAGRANERTTDQLIEVIELDGEEYLWFKPQAVDVALIRGSLADDVGNISFEHEPALLDAQAAAQAARASGGIVIVQVKKIVPRGQLDPRLVHVPCFLVDVVVEHPKQWQTYAGENDPRLSGQAYGEMPPIDAPHSAAKRIIARRAALEVPAETYVVVGFGTSSDVISVLAETGKLDDVTLCLEQGLVGGLPASGSLFGVSFNPLARIPSTVMFDGISGRGIDVCVLGLAQVDLQGNVNVSHVNGNLVGPGGFIDIARSAPEAIFCGPFTAKGLEIDQSTGHVQILQEGSIQKFVPSVDAIDFSGPTATTDGRHALYITERAVFELTPEGLLLKEVAPGISIERDILPHMGFEPIIRDPKPMPPFVFS